MRIGGIVGGIAVAVAVAGVALAQSPNMTAPDWLKKPTLSDLISVWPAQADQPGSARIKCVVTVKGALRDCEIVSQTPEGAGYGTSALLLSSLFQMKPATLDGAPVESSVVIPINFACPDGCLSSMYGMRRVRRTSNWAEAPSIDDIIAAYPKKAAAEKIAADMVVSCVVFDQGRIGRCRILSRNPPNKGFERAVSALTGKFKGPAGIKSGNVNDPVATRLRVTFDPAILGGDREVGQVNWADPLTEQARAEAFPAQARAHRVAAGRVVVRCAVRPGGVLSDCAVSQEYPAGEGFGQAALGLAAKSKVVTWTEDGRPVIGGFVSQEIAFGSGSPAR